jgi:hypothetical protein
LFAQFFCFCNSPLSLCLFGESLCSFSTLIREKRGLFHRRIKKTNFVPLFVKIDG